MKFRRRSLMASVASCVALCGFSGPRQTNDGGFGLAAGSGAVDAGPQAGAFHNSAGPLFQESCVQCHNAKTLSGDLDLERLILASERPAVADCDILRTVAGRLESGTMPPRTRPRPAPEQIAAATGWIHQACAVSPDPEAKRVVEAAATPIAPSPQIAAIASGDVFEDAVKPMIRNSCSSCHNGTAMVADLDLTRFLKMSGSEALKERELWETIARRVEARQMPPAAKPQLDPHQVASVSNWVQQQFAQLDEEAAPDPGRVTARRLNRHEYNNTVRDLLGVNLNASADFAPDPYAYGFDNIGEALSFSPALAEMYLKAAQRVAKAAIPLGPAAEAISTRYDAIALGQRNHLQIQAVHEFPADASYSVRMTWDQQMPKGTLVTGHIAVDGHEVLKQSFAYVVSQERAVTALKIPVTQGLHKVQVRMELAPNAQQPKPLRGPLPYPTALEVIGPYNVVPFERTASFRQIFFQGPPKPGLQPVYLRAILERTASRAYRRPAAKAEVDRLTNLANIVRLHGGSFYKQVQVALEAILLSPDFLFRIERDATRETTHRINDYELASRLSYFLWSSMPDDQLLSAAAAGHLHEADALHAQVRRMLADPKASALAQNFTGEWLQTQNLEFETPDAKTFPQFDAELRDAMQTETRMFFSSVLAEDRSVLDLLNGKYSFLNERLAKFYGIDGVSGPAFRRVSLEGTDRGGVMTQASVLTATSYPTRTSPTVRGKWVLTNILNTPPPEPPANVPSLASGAGDAKARSIRDRLGMHRANPVCASCHSGMDPLGFALEHYNAIGQWRDVDDGLPVDASGKLPDGTAFSGASQLQAVLMKQSGKFVNSLTEKLLTYGLGRGLSPGDRPAVRRIERSVVSNNYHFSALVYGIVDSAPFQMRHAQTPPPAAVQHVASFLHPTPEHSPHPEANHE